MIYSKESTNAGENGSQAMKSYNVNGERIGVIGMSYADCDLTIQEYIKEKMNEPSRNV